MHDLDRTQAEREVGQFESGQFEYPGELEMYGEVSGESPLSEIFQEAGLQEAPYASEYQEAAAYESALQESSYESSLQEAGLQESGLQEAAAYEYPTHEAAAYEYPAHETAAYETALSENEEMELATELLEISTEAELDQFLGKLFRRAWRGVRRVASGIARPLGGVLRAVARRALPIVGGALGSVVGGPLGGMLGSRLASGAGQLFGLELEGLSQEDREYEVARRFVRFAASAARSAAANGPSGDPRAIARAAVAQAARQYAPGLLSQLPLPAGFPAPIAGQRGVWYRKGRRIIVVGV